MPTDTDEDLYGIYSLPSKIDKMKTVLRANIIITYSRVSTTGGETLYSEDKSFTTYSNMNHWRHGMKEHEFTTYAGSKEYH